MAPPKAPLLPTAKPKHSAFFDPWTSSSTGHQRAENKAGGSTGWRLSRTAKLSVQFRDGGASSKDAPEPRSKPEDPGVLGPITNASNTATSDQLPETSNNERKVPKNGIFQGLVIYINGSTYPAISDHKLKHLLAEHGARVSIHLGRKQVTHVIVGTPSMATGGTRKGLSSRAGAGGGLASGKVQKEVQRVGGCGLKYVGVEWALESIKAGRRLPEAQFSNMKLSLSGQKTVRGSFFDVKPPAEDGKLDEGQQGAKTLTLTE